MTDEAENVQVLPKCAPAADAARWTHHWVGPKGGDVEPWLWLPSNEWVRGNETVTPVTMAARGWVYAGPCEHPEVVADLRKRLAAAEERAGRDVLPFRAAIARATGGGA